MKIHDKSQNFSRTLMIVGVITVTIVVAVAVLVYVLNKTIFTPRSIAERELEKISKDYYENFFYDNYLSEQKAVGKTDLTEVLGKYTDAGLAPVHLKMLLLYDDRKNEGSRGAFANDRISCNTNTTTAIFFPQAPYGKTDYRVEYKLNCDEK